MSATVTLIRKSNSAVTVVEEYKLFAALKYPGAVRTEDDLIKIDGVDYVLSSLSSTGGNGATLIGSIGFAEVNAGAAAATFAKAIGTKAAGKGFLYVIQKVTQAFVSPTRDTDTLEVDLANPANTLGVVGQYASVIGGSAQVVNGPAAITATIAFAGGGNNPQDFTAGNVEFYAVLFDVPTV